MIISISNRQAFNIDSFVSVSEIGPSHDVTKIQMELSKFTHVQILSTCFSFRQLYLSHQGQFVWTVCLEHMLNHTATCRHKDRRLQLVLHYRTSQRQALYDLLHFITTASVTSLFSSYSISHPSCPRKTMFSKSWLESELNIFQKTVLRTFSYTYLQKSTLNWLEYA